MARPHRRAGVVLYNELRRAIGMARLLLLLVLPVAGDDPDRRPPAQAAASLGARRAILEDLFPLTPPLFGRAPCWSSPLPRLTSRRDLGGGRVPMISATPDQPSRAGSRPGDLDHPADRDPVDLRASAPRPQEVRVGLAAQFWTRRLLARSESSVWCSSPADPDRHPDVVLLGQGADLPASGLLPALVPDLFSAIRAGWTRCGPHLRGAIVAAALLLGSLPPMAAPHLRRPRLARAASWRR